MTYRLCRKKLSKSKTKRQTITYFCNQFNSFSAAFVPGVRYNFHIYGSVANSASLLEKKTGYLRELRKLATCLGFVYLLNSFVTNRRIPQPSSCNYLKTYLLCHFCIINEAFKSCTIMYMVLH